MKACLILALAFLAGCVRCKCPCCAPTEVKTMEDLEAEWKDEGQQDLSDIDWSKMVIVSTNYLDHPFLLNRTRYRLYEEYEP